VASFTQGLSASAVESRLLVSLQELQRAESNALLWFCEIRDRRLYRELECSSIWQYAQERLGFSKTKTAYFLRLAKSFQELPALRQSVVAGEITWTQAREVVKVATPRTESVWIERAKNSSRRELEREVARTRVRAKAKRRARTQGNLLDPVDGSGAAESHGVESSAASDPGLASGERQAGPSSNPAPAVDAMDVPASVTLRFSPEQYARWEAAMAELQASGERSGREAVALYAAEVAANITRVNSGKVNSKSEVRETLVPAGSISETDEPTLETAGPVVEAATSRPGSSAEAPAHSMPLSRRPSGSQIFIRRCPDCEVKAVMTTRGDLPLSQATFERLLCDARVHTPGGRNEARIPDRLRRAVLERDGYRCRAPGCGRTRFIEVHHRSLRENGGPNKLKNLISLCSGCHDVFHARERRERRPQTPRGEGARPVVLGPAPPA